jgi:hypothetical protein
MWQYNYFHKMLWMTGTELALARKQASAGIIVKKNFITVKDPPKWPGCLPRVAVKACLDLATLRVISYLCGRGALNIETLWALKWQFGPKKVKHSCT